MVRKSGTGLPKGATISKHNRPGSATGSKMPPKSQSQVMMNDRYHQFSSYQLDAVQLLGNRLNKKLREYFGSLKDFYC